MRSLDELRTKAARAWKIWNDFISPTMNTITLLVALVACIGFVVAKGSFDAQLEEMKTTQKQYASQLERTEMMRQQLQERPQVVYTYTLGVSGTDSRFVSAMADELLNDFYSQVAETKALSPGKSYLDAVEAILPITRTIAPQRMVAQVNLQNTGKATATKVRTMVQTDRLISDVQVDSLEPSLVVAGGIGQQRVTVEIDRLTPNDKASISVAAGSTGSSGQMDKVVIDLPSKISLLGTAYSLYLMKGSVKLGPWGLSPVLANDHLPEITYVPARAIQLTIMVTSNEGVAVQAN